MADDDVPALRVSEQEIDEAVAQIMDFAGITERGNYSGWRDMRDYASNVKEIIESMLNGSLKE